MCVIALNANDYRDPRILLQQRSKWLDDTPYKGYWEIPQGKVDRRETIGQAAVRELEEETGLKIKEFIVGHEHDTGYKTPRSSHLQISQPLICVTDSVQNHLALCVVVRAEGVLRSNLEAKNHKWCTAGEVRRMINSQEVFPLNIPMLSAYLEQCSKL